MRPYRRAYVEISNICNLKCSFCPEVARPAKVMEPVNFQRLAAQLAPLVDEVCLHLMGEPLNHPHLDQILAGCTVEQLPVNLTTNGVLLTGARRDLLLSDVVRQVNISVHSFAANFAGADVAAYAARVFRYTRAALAKRPDQYINLRLWDQGDEAADSPTSRELLAAIAAEFGVDLATKPINIRRRKNLQLAGRIYLHFDSRFVWPAMDLPLRSGKGFCHGLGNHFGIHADGKVVPCCLDKEAVIELGNINSDVLTKVLSSPRAARMRAGFAAGSLVEDLCQRCQFIERFDGKARRLNSVLFRHGQDKAGVPAIVVEH